jgi:magnesium transporter
MSTTSAAQSLVALLRNTNAATLRNVLLQWSLHDVADALVQLPVADQASVLRILPTRAAAAVFEYLSTPAQRALIPVMSQDDLAVLLNDMAPDDRTLFLSELPTYATHELLTLLGPEERSQAEKLLAMEVASLTSTIAD